MSPSPFVKSPALLSKRRLGVAGAAALLGCAACCALPALLAAGVWGSAASAISLVLRPGREAMVGAIVFVVAIVAMAVRQRLARRAAATCETACDADARCCAEEGRASSTRAPD